MGIDFKARLNEAQYRAVTHEDGPLLVIAGAGSGKTRTIVYRLARLCEQGVSPENILLLTFTRKASQEMITRAEALLGRPLKGAVGGTFHSFAFHVLRRHGFHLGLPDGFTLMDRGDSDDMAKSVKDSLGLGVGDRSFPKKGTVMDMISKSRNKETAIEEVVAREAFHLVHYVPDMEDIARGYAEFKDKHGLLDYDDLLFSLERLLLEHPEVRTYYSLAYRHVLVDEYQDTNLVQARLVRLLAGDSGGVMAVGDDAQSIYAFRGANVANILKFPEIFPNTTIVRLERNYRSTQPILDLTNAILKNAAERYDKNLFTERTDGPGPRLVRPLSDRSQAALVVDEIVKHSRDLPLHEIAVLFRSGYHSYPLEIALTRAGLPFRKYGGAKFSEAAHVKDVLAYLRVAVNPSDTLAWRRLLVPLKGVGAKTADKISAAVIAGDAALVAMNRKKRPGLGELLDELDALRVPGMPPSSALERVMVHYLPVLAATYPDDYPRRQAGLDELARVAAGYKDIAEFLADLSLETGQDRGKAVDEVVLSTAHSAKGLEFKAVIVIDLVENRFPSKRALSVPEDLEEERRLLYVACTRAKDRLSLFVPSTLYNRYTGISENTVPSPFIGELPGGVYEELRESYSGGLNAPACDGERTAPALPAPENPAKDPKLLGFCKHKIFGRGKIVAEVPPNKYRVNFPGFGLKMIMADYLEMLDS